MEKSTWAFGIMEVPVLLGLQTGVPGRAAVRVTGSVFATCLSEVAFSRGEHVSCTCRTWSPLSSRAERSPQRGSALEMGPLGPEVFPQSSLERQVS